MNAVSYDLSQINTFCRSNLDVDSHCELVQLAEQNLDKNENGL